MSKRVIGLMAVFCVLAMAASFIVGCGKKAPEIKSIAPVAGEVETKVTITGENFGESREAKNGVVSFAGKAAQVESWSETSVTVLVPGELDPGEYEVTVQTDDGESNKTYFGVKEAEKKEETKEETKTEEPKTDVQIIEVYMKEHDISQTGVEGVTLTISLYKTSETDPTWSIYQMPMGQGLDVTYFLVHKTDEKTEVVATWMGEGSAADYGGPADLTTPPEEG